MSFQSLIVAIVIVVCIALPCETLTPGFSSFVGENALQYMCHEAVPIVEAKVKDYKLSDVDRTLHTPIGNVDFKLSEIHIGSFGKLETDQFVALNLQLCRSMTQYLYIQTYIYI